MKHNLFATVVLLLMLDNNSTAQSTASDTSLPAAATNSSYVELSANYISNIVFAGRKDSVAVPYLSPGIAYYHKSGLYAQGSVSILTSANENRLDLYTLSGGYHYSNQTLAAGAQVTKYFFNERSYNVQSAMSGYGLAYLGYDLSNVVMLYADAMVSFGSSSDFFTGVELSHSFYTVNNQLTITPAFYTLFGTQRYYDAYYSTRHVGMQGSGGNGNGPGGGGGSISGTTMVVEASTAFQLRSLELSVTIAFSIDRFTLQFNPVYVWPVNPSGMNVNGVLTKEVLENVFYWGVGLRYRFGKN